MVEALGSVLLSRWEGLVPCLGEGVRLGRGSCQLPSRPSPPRQAHTQTPGPAGWLAGDLQGQRVPTPRQASQSGLGVQLQEGGPGGRDQKAPAPAPLDSERESHGPSHTARPAGMVLGLVGRGGPGSSQGWGWD